MADDRFDSRPNLSRESLPWTDLFRTFRVALDPKKLILAAAGILVMWSGWWLFSWATYHIYTIPTKAEYTPPSVSQLEQDNPGKDPTDYARDYKKEQEEQNRKFDDALKRWLQMHRLAGSDVAEVTFSDGKTAKVWGGKLRTMPWHENRGPNPYQLILDADKPWLKGHFFDWLLTQEVPVLLEPLVKFLEPVVALINPRTGTATRIYLMIIVLWTLATWALFGGAITRMAVVELAGKETVGIKQAVRFVIKRYLSYFGSPLVPLGLVGVLIVVDIVFGLLHMIPFVGDLFVDGIFWPLMILTGLGKALLLVGLVGYPMMYPTISAEGSDTLDALSRSYNYVYQSPWNYIWYSLVSLLYGAVVIFFIGLMGTMTAMLGKWGMSFTPVIETAHRSPEYLCVYTPTSFGWRETLLKNSEGEQYTAIQDRISALQQKFGDGTVSDETLAEMTALEKEKIPAGEKYKKWKDTFWWYNTVGAYMVAFWVTLLFLLVLGFGYSFFWTASTMIYLLMRRKVDDTDIDEVYLEEEMGSDPYAAPPPSTLPMTPPPAPAPQMVDLNVRTSTPPPAPTVTPPPPPVEPPTPPTPPVEPPPSA